MFTTTETWLLPPARLPTSWQQFHLYGSPVAGQYRGSMGVSALVSPRCPLPVVEFSVNCKYALGLQLGQLGVQATMDKSLDLELNRS
ncbi:hypothetical protein G6F57_018034 [Rhizopus arrhizus]|nr:hypothetical protein G6F33_013566 [Rhizopus arrhizus]KAG0924409.1 hypothetical protein G6F30_013637 [Rhizopus arrhizus]KAG0972274.1 hypothetical protein G6F29_013587 [Rhizopus arrhizus]KAG0973631.1 hypothetical protein G6F28_013537 [Rhizopus arrhizus]KAG1000809.1 hypothetical protein G6F27_013465 [Rhizopus arrhizus]